MRAAPVSLEIMQQTVTELRQRGGKSLCMAALIATLYGLGARISEVLMLTRGDFIRRDGTFRRKVRRVKLKAGKPVSVDRTLPEWVCPVIIEWLDFQRTEFGRWRSGEPVFTLSSGSRAMNRETAWRKIKLAFHGAGVNIGTHTPRKTKSVLMFDAWNKRLNNPMEAAKKVQESLGHAALETTWNYLISDTQDPETVLDEL